MKTFFHTNLDYYDESEKKKKINIILTQHTLHNTLDRNPDFLSYNFII